ncbi:GAF domain-containing protein [Tenacibaculum larymnensis]|uniref:GAF domain-containing protein n=1 Tax=Tenacibaculum larymnensis TaxID=2878201 RepID=A0A9X4EWG8_9FLAO|nr:GAF domain-containing protein [Tenacibaculum larymnensis]MDE1207691.1 GAF domain-containing protein [Tenacibaculum larymnensis]
MNIRRTKDIQNIELPFKLKISFEKIVALFQKYAAKEQEKHPYHESSKKIVREANKAPELINGFSDESTLEKYQDTIEMLLEPLFPELLLENEIKAVSIPFTFTSFKFTSRFEKILQNAGDDYELKVRNFESDLMYKYACSIILTEVYNYSINVKRPFYFDIPDKTTNTIKNYRAAFNADFMEISPTENAPKITEEDIKFLLDNFDDIDVWKEKFPPDSYIFKGFGIMNLFDVTTDEIISEIRTSLIKKDDDLVTTLQEIFRRFFEINDLSLGFSIFETDSNNFNSSHINKEESLVLNYEKDVSCDCIFCNYVLEKLFINNETLAISDVEKYGKQTENKNFYQRLKDKNIGSIILVPIQASTKNSLAIIEFASPRPFELNSINQNKLQDLIPLFKIAVDRFSEEHQNILEATIQENYTSIHPTVKWRFYEAAERFHIESYETKEKVKIEDIVFPDVHPLYGQSDIKGSSIARNKAIKEDLTTQLSLAISVLLEACKVESLPIYKELRFRVEEYLSEVKKGLKAGDEIAILDFLKREIYPVFNHIKTVNKDLSSLVESYISRLDPNLQVVYEKRKAYEDSVTLLNDKLASFIDTRQKEAQQMFPHYFERYKTDGVEYNMYIGQSLTREKKYDDLYLYNLRLWQLQVMCEMENVALKAAEKMEHKLRVASLILVHSNPLAIKFRMDEKQFDVDGAYNIRYEIIKKRIDKAHIKGTEERLTVPGKIAIVYSQEKDAEEYYKYIKYLQSKNLLGNVEKLDIEDLQGVSGLKALRAEVIYNKNFDTEKTMTIDELIQEFK